MMKFVYKDRKYTWNEWTEEYNRFVECLELPDDFRIDLNLREFGLIQDIGYSIAIDKFRELYSIIAGARSALMNAYLKFYDSNIISWESGYKGHLWMRFEHLKNAIIWYNASEDYIYQILWFAYDMYPDLINSKESYQNCLKKCNYDKLLSTLKNLEPINKDAKSLRIKISEYRNNPDVVYLREQLANNLKHRANIQAIGLEDLRMTGFKIQSKNGNQIFNSEWIEPELIDIDETIELLKRIHIKLVEYGRYILNFMNLNDMFIADEKGIHLIIRDKSVYKRISVSKKNYIKNNRE